jgi:hypothetical protein
MSKIDVMACARCGEDHKELEFVKFKRSVIVIIERAGKRIFTDWAMCPKTNEPVIMEVS